MSLAQTVGNTGSAMLRPCDRITPEFLDSAFHAIASCHDRASAAGLDLGTLRSLQGCADLVVAMQSAGFWTEDACALIGCMLEGLGEHLCALEDTTPAPHHGLGVNVVPFPGGDVA